MKIIVREGSMTLALNSSLGHRYIRDKKLSELIKRCQGYDYLFPIREVLEAVRHGKDKKPYLFKGYCVLHRDRGFYYEVVVWRMKNE